MCNVRNLSRLSVIVFVFFYFIIKLIREKYHYVLLQSFVIRIIEIKVFSRIYKIREIFVRKLFAKLRTLALFKYQL